jgi:hypothetical protein
MRRCWKCGDNDPTVNARPGVPSNLRVLCAPCHVDVRTSSVRRVDVDVRDHNDRYARMAERLGV